MAHRARRSLRDATNRSTDASFAFGAVISVSGLVGTLIGGALLDWGTARVKRRVAAAAADERYARLGHAVVAGAGGVGSVGAPLSAAAAADAADAEPPAALVPLEADSLVPLGDDAPVPHMTLLVCLEQVPVALGVSGDGRRAGGRHHPPTGSADEESHMMCVFSCRR